ncbi:MAG: putative sugar O-methyltransferase [Rhodospirillaceae bacterium]
MDFKHIANLSKRRREEFELLSKGATDNVYASVSELWQGLFSNRPNFMSEEKFHLFRNSSVGGAVGLGDSTAGYQERKRFFESMLRLLMLYDVPADIFKTVTEPTLGTPEVFSYQGNLFSANFAKNVVSAYTIAERFNAFSAKTSDLKVCEIGAGFGSTAYALHEYLDISSYTVIDLPENLYLASMYLPLCMPGKTHGVVFADEPDTLSCDRDLNFCVPDIIDKIERRDFDLVINVASMGEMPLKTAQAYSQWILKHLTATGIFYFVNRQSVPGISGAKCFSDFNLHHFDVQSVVPRKLPSRPANAIHYQVTASAAEPKQGVSEYCLDAMGHLISFGFGKSIESIVQACEKGELSSSLDSSLKRLEKFFSENDPQKKWEIIAEQDDNLDPLILKVLRASFILLSSNAENVLEMKDEILGHELDLKLRARLTGLFAETEKRLSIGNWSETVMQLNNTLPEFASMMGEELSQDNPTIYYHLFSANFFPKS